MGILSMTGFGTASFEVSGRAYRVELKSVNHRNFSMRLHAPGELSRFETGVKQQLRAALVRGAVDAHVQLESMDSEARTVAIDRDGIAVMMTALNEIARELDAPPPTLEAALRFGDFVRVTTSTIDEDEAKGALTAAIGDAAEALTLMRRREGEALKADFLARLGVLERAVTEVEASTPEILAGMEARLREKVARSRAQVGGELDEARIAAELVVFSDRADVTEECVRVKTHLERFVATIDEADDSERGKRLDFLSQELLREFNTIGSKCRDAEVATLVVDAKVELEKIREQVQNIV